MNQGIEQQLRGGNKKAGMVRALVASGLVAAIANLALFWRDILAAAEFGIGAELDAYVAASAIPVFVSGIFANAVAPAFLPVVTKQRQLNGLDAARTLLAKLHTTLLMLAACASAFLYTFESMLLRLMCEQCLSAQLDRIEESFRVLAPLCLVQVYAAVLKTGLLSERQTFIPTISPLCVPIVGVGLLSSPLSSIGVGVVAWSIFAGNLAEVLFLRATCGPRFGPRFPTSTTGDVDNSLRSYSNLLIAGLFTASAAVIDAAFAARLPPGSATSLVYGGKIVVFIIGVSSVAISNVPVPAFTLLAAQKKWGELRKDLRRFLLAILIGSGAISCIISLWSDGLTRVLFERGNVAEDGIRMAENVLSILVLQLPFHLGGGLFVRMLSVLGKSNKVLVIAGLGALMNFTLNLVFTPIWGLSGIAVSTTTVFAFTFFGTGWVLRQRINELERTISAGST